MIAGSGSGGAGAAGGVAGAAALRTHSSSSAAAKVEALCAGGTALLHVIVDWDRTCTTYMHNGRKGDTCHGVVESRRGPELLEKACALNAKFHPIEVDPLISREEKIPHMRAWYAAVNGLLATEGRISRTDLREDVRVANMGLREGIPELLRAAVARGFPVTILSAGIGDVIEEALRQLFGPLPPHIRVVSNRMVWHGDVCVGFSEPVIHSASAPAPRKKQRAFFYAPPSIFLLTTVFNKTSRLAFSEQERAQLAAERPHVVLVGDSDGDATMAEGLDASVLLKIGILNDPAAVEKSLPAYSALFDIVLQDDPPLWPLLEILRRLGC